MLYGLEVCNLCQADVALLDSVQTGILRRIQSLSDRVATFAVYGLLGIRPTEQGLDIRKFSLLASESVLIDEASLEYEIAQRQFAVKDINSDSWFMQCNLLLHKYGLPNVYCIRDVFQSKGAFKDVIKTEVDEYVANQWQA